MGLGFGCRNRLYSRIAVRFIVYYLAKWRYIAELRGSICLKLTNYTSKVGIIVIKIYWKIVYQYLVRILSIFFVPYAYCFL